MDFIKIATRSKKKGVVEVYPKFLIKRSDDLMIRGGDFYAIWIEDKKLWSTDEQDAIRLIDREIDIFIDEHRESFGDDYIKSLHLWDAESGMIDIWHKYCQKQLRDNFHMLDDKLIFSNTETKKEDYASKRLPYPLEKGSYDAYDRLMSVLYSEEERKKIEWAIGSIVSGDSKFIQKFMVLYGSAGTGKSTLLNIIQKLFAGYYSVFDAKSLGSSNNAFALEAFKSNPLVAIQHDGDLSRIEDNTRLNSLVSHEMMTVNEKFKSQYANQFKCFLFMGTNKPVKITDAKSGLIRRLIDVSPTGDKVTPSEYRKLTKQIDFELGAIAYHCLEVYRDDPNAYENYIPLNMMGASNDFYNFVLDSYLVFEKEDGTSLKAAWEMYKVYCDDANIGYPLSKRVFKEELKSYFKEFSDRSTAEGGRIRSYYSGFRKERFVEMSKDGYVEAAAPWLIFDRTVSLIDSVYADCPAQYANENGTPVYKWASVKTTLKDLDTSKVHYVKPLANHIVIDFDIPDDNGEKSFEKNFAEAVKWPPTYAELSKSGAGIHLHYIYQGDPTKLSRIYSEHVEVKVFTGDSSLRRKLTNCNGLQIATISSGLPLKGEKNVVNIDQVKSEKGLRRQIERNLRKEIHPYTKPSMDFIKKILDDANASGLHYDISNMKQDIITFAANSSNNSDYCLKLIKDMKFKSDDEPEGINLENAPIVFYDVEVFPNLFLVNWKYAGNDCKVVRMINPSSSDIEELIKYKLIGFNCRRYDNHILYGRLIGYDNKDLYHLSQRIISGDNNAFFGDAYNLSYTDVYDFAATKQSLKKWEIEITNIMASKVELAKRLINSGMSLEDVANHAEINLMPELLKEYLDEKREYGIKHMELGLPWDQPVPEELWPKVAEYCDNDVIATEAVFDYLKADWIARQTLSDISGLSVNDTTNQHTTRIMFGKNKHPQNQFNYRDMGDESAIVKRDDYTAFDSDGRPIFPGYEFKNGKSLYRGEEVGEGGYVYAEPGIYHNIALLDIASMHPSSIVAENLFGDEYTQNFNDILQARIAIKHKDFDKAKTMLGGKLAKYLTDPKEAKNLAQALKIAINSVYGLTSAKFDNPFRDPRNIDNIVAKRGALFMVNLKHEVQKRGFTVAHIKTDSIKIPNATPEIISFVMEYGKMYGYNFEHEATYEKMCLVNDAVYIAKYADGAHEVKLPTGETIMTPWTATGTQFQVPYVFKTLFSKSDICFRDKCETKSVSTALYLDMNEDLTDVSLEEKQLDKLETQYRKGQLSDTSFEPAARKLSEKIAKGHNYIFIGKVGLFCPIKKGAGGGLLMREKDGKYYTATGAKGYRWLESEMVQELGKEADIDEAYYISLVDAAVDTISKYGDFEAFVTDDSDFMKIPEGAGEEIVF